MKNLTFLSLTLTILACSDLGVPPVPQELPPPTGELIWVGKTFIGGQQCTNDNYVPPNTKQLLNNAGIAVAKTDVEHYAVCAACSCPAYAAMHYALISNSQLAEAQALGFQVNKPPSER